LINHTVALSQTNQCSHLLWPGVGVKVEFQPNSLETDRRIFGYSESAAKIEVAFSANFCIPELNSQSGRHGIQSHPGAYDQCFQ